MSFQAADIAPVDLSEVAAAFSRGEVENAAKPLRRIDTHLSHVFLTETLVYKLKRPVRLPFVDFSGLEQRRLACQAELETNRRLDSPFYLDVLPIVQRSKGGFRLGGEGRIVDWIVVMRRFDQSQQFDELAAVNGLSVELAVETANRIAAMHAGAEVSLRCGHAADYRQVISDLRRTEERAAAKLGLEIADPSPFDDLDTELVRIGPLIEQRRAEGKVRRGHGDLHLRNLCLFEGKVQPFDALEFSERLATTDILYDLAFFLMDLRRAGLPRQASAAMNRYWDEAGEDERALTLLPFFMALRAAVRMAVALDAGNLTEAHTYRVLSFDLLTHQPPVTVAIGGLSGSGKSAVAEALAPLLPGPVGARLLRSDVLRKRALGLPENEKAPTESYATAHREIVYRELCSAAARAVAAGASIIVDATFTAAATRDAVATVPNVRVHTFWLDAPLALRLTRVSRRPKGASDADVDVAAAQSDPSFLPASWIRIDASRPLEAVVADLLRRVQDTSGSLPPEFLAGGCATSGAQDGVRSAHSGRGKTRHANHGESFEPKPEEHRR